MVSVFDPDTVKMINRAYETAVDVLDARPSARNDDRAQATRVGLAAIIMGLARAGERDERRLRDRALTAMLSRAAD